MHQHPRVPVSPARGLADSFPVCPAPGPARRRAPAGQPSEPPAPTAAELGAVGWFAFP